MPYRFVFTEGAKKDIAGLDIIIRKRLQKKFLYFAELEDITATAKMLTNPNAGTLRLRAGNYRIICDIDGDTIVILRVQHRREVYR